MIDAQTLTRVGQIIDRCNDQERAKIEAAFTILTTVGIITADRMTDSGARSAGAQVMKLAKFFESASYMAMLDDEEPRRCGMEG